MFLLVLFGIVVDHFDLIFRIGYNVCLICCRSAVNIGSHWCTPIVGVDGADVHWDLHLSRLMLDRTTLASTITPTFRLAAGTCTIIDMEHVVLLDGLKIVVTALGLVRLCCSGGGTCHCNRHCCALLHLSFPICMILSIRSTRLVITVNAFSTCVRIAHLSINYLILLIQSLFVCSERYLLLIFIITF